MLNADVNPVIVKVAVGLSNEEALVLEEELIKQIGTRLVIEGVPRGPLTNVKSSDRKGKTKAASPSNATLEKMSIARTALWNDPKYRDDLLKQSIEQTNKLLVAYNTDPEYKARWLKSIREAASTESSKEKKRNNTTNFWSDPANREKRTAAIREANAKRWTPEAREEKRKQNEKMWEDQEHRNKVSKSNSERWNDPAWAEKTKKNMSEGKKKVIDTNNFSS